MADSDVDTRPEFVTCVVLCYLGITPALLRAMFDGYVSAIQQYCKSHGAAGTEDSDFEKSLKGFHKLTTIGQLKYVLEFLASGTLTVPVLDVAVDATELASVAALRSALLRRLAVVASESALGTAFKIVSKAAVIAQVAEVAAIVTYCAGVKVVTPRSWWSEQRLRPCRRAWHLPRT